MNSERILYAFGFALVFTLAVLVYLGLRADAYSDSPTTSLERSVTNASGLPEAFAKETIPARLVKMIAAPDKELQSSLGLSDDDYNSFERYVSNRTNIDAARRFLLETTPKFEFRPVYVRYKAIETLIGAIAMPNNPNREEAIAAIGEVLLTDNLDRWNDKYELVMSLGDRGWLYEAMLHYEPERAEGFRKQAEGTRMSRMFDTAAKHYATLNASL